MRGRRTLAMVLSAMMTLSLCLTLLPRTAFAIADGDVFIGSVQVAGGGKTGKQYLLANGTTGDSGNYAIEYDPTVSPAKITVKDNASISAAYHNTGSNTSSCIYSKNVNLEIYIERGKTLTLSNLSTGPTPTDYDHGIHLAGTNNALSVSGGGTLTVTVTGGGAKSSCYGIYAGPFTVSGNTTTVTAMGGVSRNESYGVCAVGKITVYAGSSLTGNAGSVSGSADDNLSSGVRCTSLEVGGTLNARGGNARRSSYGVYVKGGDVTIAASGSLTATGGDVSSTDVEGVSYGVYSTNNMTVSGTLTGNGGTVTLGTGNGYAATSVGVYVGDTLTASDGTVTGNGGAATANNGAATSLGVHIGGAGSVTGNSGKIDGTAGASGTQGNASSIGIDCVGSLTVGIAAATQTAALAGTGGTAGTTGSGNSAESVGVRTQGQIIVPSGATLTGTGGTASTPSNDNASSRGVSTNGQSIIVSGTLKGTGNGSTGGTSYGVTAGTGSISLDGGGSMTAIANGTGTNTSYGVEAGSGITMTGNSHLIAKVAATANAANSAKPMRSSGGQNALTADTDTAVWRESSSGTFAPISTYNANGNAEDMQPRQYLEVKNGDGLKAAPASVNFGESTVGGTTPAAQTVDVTNTSGRDLTLTQPTLSNYTVTLPQATLAAGASMTVSVQPTAATLNTAADYGTTLTLSEATTTNPARVEIPLAFTVNAAPTVILDVNPLAVFSGEEVTLTATASGGTTPYTYEWSDGTNTWTTTTNTSTANPTVRTSYTVRVQDKSTVWSAVSGAKRVDVTSAAPVFTTHPQSQTVPVGARATYTAAATGRPTLFYRWQLSTDNGATWSDITGATGTSYTTPPVTAAMNGQLYRCVVTSDAAPNGVPSNPATLTVPAPMNAPKTGDNTPLTLLVGLVLLCGAGGAVVGAHRKRLGE